MTADESSAASQIMKIGTNRAFDAADIGKHRAWMKGGHQAYGWRDRADGGANHHHVGLGEGAGQIGDGFAIAKFLGADGDLRTAMMEQDWPANAT
jgi:hypothetical protein